MRPRLPDLEALTCHRRFWAVCLRSDFYSPSRYEASSAFFFSEGKIPLSDLCKTVTFHTFIGKFYAIHWWVLIFTFLLWDTTATLPEEELRHWATPNPKGHCSLCWTHCMAKPKLRRTTWIMRTDFRELNLSDSGRLYFPSTIIWCFQPCSLCCLKWNMSYLFNLCNKQRLKPPGEKLVASGCIFNFSNDRKFKNSNTFYPEGK